MEIIRIMQCPGARSSWLFLHLCVRDKRKEQLPGSRDIEMEGEDHLAVVAPLCQGCSSLR